MKPMEQLKAYIAAGEQEIFINLINWTAKQGPAAVRLLVDAGYKPDNMGPQRVYKLQQ